MKINRIKFWTGPNLYSFRPTIWVELDLEELEDKPSHLLPGFVDRLLHIMPTLKTHTCSLGYPGGLVERLREGTWMGHILEHMALEIQHLAGIPVKRGKTVTSERKGIYFVTFDYKEKESGLHAFHAAYELVEGLLEGKEDLDAAPYVTKTAELYYANKLGPSTEAIFEAAKARKIPVERVGKDSFLRLGTGSRQKYVQATVSSQTSYLAVENSCDKEMTKRLLEDAGLPVPEGTVVRSSRELPRTAESLGFPLVIKPLNGRQGQGVVTNIQSPEQLHSAFTQVGEEGRDYIVERYFAGEDYRFVVVGGELVAASLRIPPRVTGDGKKTIRELIEEENLNPLRGECHEKPMTRIPLDERTECYLAKNGLSLEAVPRKGEEIEVLGNANLSTGGKAIDVTDTVHADYRSMAIRAAGAVGLDIAGIDIISPDVTVPFNPDKAVILEVNAAPGIRMHHYPSEGKSRDVGGAIMDYLFPSREEATIPVVAVTGTNGKTTTSRLVAHLLKKEGRRIGLTNSDGVWVDDQVLDTGDCSGPGSARRILTHPEVDLAVLETARGGMLREGLAFRYCDVGIVTNVSEDHLGLDGVETMDDLRKLKQLVAEVVLPEGTCILNADDEHCLQMAEHTNGRVVYFSLRADNAVVREAVKSGGEAWYLDEGWIVCARNGEAVRFLPAAHIPLTIKGLALHNIANVMAGLAAAHALGKTLAELRNQVITFFPSLKQNRGRFNVLEKDGRILVADYAHNVAGVEAMFTTIKGMEKKRVITVASAAGDRPDKAIVEMGTVIGRESDYFIVKEDHDLRGRPPEEAAALLTQGAHRGGLTGERIKQVLDEKKAFHQAWQMSMPGDILLMLHDSFRNFEDFLKEMNRNPGRLKKVD
ncbi:cyanophycin synthetase [Paenibacillus aurantius]|uniref:Cyanophycin synthetase n=1 Tax=Paenibacillus aurantius TaxID=2918900 RepID=A0AA96LL72_9BACL|nr:cyanophycin synthetase [Paenibacillus aurantius]WNQ13427.1 cyanophycin synthetase [Paenibacillus aurantius]